MPNMKQLANRYAARTPDWYTFEHIDRESADEMTEKAAAPHIVETINGTLTSDGRVHHNSYFSYSLNDACALAALLAIHSIEVAEWVVKIRKATRTEINYFCALDEQHNDTHPKLKGA